MPLSHTTKAAHYGGSSPQDNSNYFTSSLSTLTPASTDMVDNMETRCAVDTMISILNEHKNMANSKLRYHANKVVDLFLDKN